MAVHARGWEGGGGGGGGGGGRGGGGGGGLIVVATRVFTNMHGRLHWQARTRVRTHAHTRFGPHALHSWSCYSGL